MKVLKPDWINHNGLPIYSIDIHPDGTRVATGGQGDDSGRVVIWNMAPVVLEEEEENEESTPRMLCQLDNHLACVNCVRWSGSGKFLASGGDDKLVMVWCMSKSLGSNSVFGSKGKVNVEGWRCAHTLRAHQGDILDMAWSPHDLYLATCSVDNTIIIWRPENFPEIVAVLKGHTGLVKGVSWDPVGKYLGSQSDDKTVRIWRTVDWSEEAVISKPFEQCSGTTMVLRLSWSPDGQYLVTAHAMNGSGPTAKIIDRDGWSCNRDIVGHRKAVTCVRYSRKLTEKESRKGKLAQSSTCALGSRDRGISVWMCSLSRPLVVIQDLFTSPVLDLAWGPSGTRLMACSGDGTTAYIEFTTAEIGRPLSESEKDSVLERLYGKSDILEGGNALNVVENPSFLSVLPAAKEKSPLTTNTVSNGLTPTITSRPQTTKQIETRTSDGRRRITPIFIPLSHENNEEIAPFGSDTMPSFSSCQKSRIIVERRDDVVVPPNVTPAKSTPTTSSQISSITSNKSNTPNTNLCSPSVTESGGFTGLVSMVEKVETRKEKEKIESDKTPKLSHKAKRRKLSVCPEPPEPEVHTPRLLLPPLPASTASIARLWRSNNYIKIENGVQKGPHGYISVIKFISPEDPKPLWEVALGSEVVSCVGTSTVIAVATSDHCLRLVSCVGGELMLPPIALGAPTSVLKLSSGYLLVVTTTGRLSVWCLSGSGEPRALLSNESVSPLAPQQGEMRIKDCSVSKSGEPLLALSSGKAYFHSLRHNSWLLIGNHNDPVQRNAHSGYRNTQRSLSPTGESLPLKSIQAAALNGTGVGANRGVGPTSELAPLCTLTYLDSQLSASLALGSQQEYKFWLLAQARFLVQRGLEKRLKRLCEELLGPTHSSWSHTSSSNWQEEILGLRKHSLLEEILQEAASNLKLQRLVTEIRDQLTSRLFPIIDNLL
nr:protein HIRA-like isoform X3 [Halyomorpha halys]